MKYIIYGRQYDKPFDYQDFIENINDLIDKGYQPLGAPFFGDYTPKVLYQAMILVHDDNYKSENTFL